MHGGASFFSSRRYSTSSSGKGDSAKDGSFGDSKTGSLVSSPRSNGGDWITKEVKPPLPPIVVDLLNACSLCYLSTSNLQSKSHLSLMTFTYVQSHEVIVLSTRKDTLKLKNLLESPQVAILVHDFPHLQNSKKEDYGNTYSITLYGTTRVAQGRKRTSFERSTWSTIQSQKFLYPVKILLSYLSMSNQQEYVMLLTKFKHGV